MAFVGYMSHVMTANRWHCYVNRDITINLTISSWPKISLCIKDRL